MFTGRKRARTKTAEEATWTPYMRALLGNGDPKMQARAAETPLETPSPCPLPKEDLHPKGEERSMSHPPRGCQETLPQ